MKPAVMPRPLVFPSGPLPWLKPAVFVGSLAPLFALVMGALRGTLGANAIAEGLNQLGLLALIFVIASLTCTPLKTLTGFTWPIRIRKMLGLFGAFYAWLHLLTYAGLDQALDFKAILKDITERKFILLGFIAFVLLVPLAVTSTSGMVKRLGFVWWKRLHRLAYVAATLGVIHFVLRVKKDVTEPAIYGSILAFSFAIRLASYIKEKAASTPAKPPRADVERAM
jgi:methionine sulfoxide reductase heme-binding subunit